jgi:hypothetical protein
MPKAKQQRQAKGFIQARQFRIEHFAELAGGELVQRAGSFPLTGLDFATQAARLRRAGFERDSPRCGEQSGHHRARMTRRHGLGFSRQQQKGRLKGVLRDMRIAKNVSADP